MAQGDELMQLMMGGAGKTGGPAPSPAPGGAPVTSPMTTPQPQDGAVQAAQVDIALAQDLMEKSLSSFPADSDEYRSVLGALSTLNKKFGKARENAKGLIPAELKQLIQSQQASPELQAMQGAAAPGGGGQPQQQMAA